MTTHTASIRYVWTVTLGLSTAILALPSTGLCADWPLIPPADLSATKPRVDPNADAEVLLWDVRVTDSAELDDVATILEHHLRIKIFTDRGREAQSKVDITYTDNARVRDVEGRTVSPTGTVSELRGQDVFDRTIIQTGGFKLKAKSFVMAAAVPGSIIEYRWREIRDGELADGLELPLYREIPVQIVRYHVRPLAVRSIGYQMRTQSFNLAKLPDMRQEERGYTMFEASNVAALRREPFMPPSLSIGPWMLLYYADLATADRTPERFWQEWGKDVYDVYKAQLKPNNAIRVTAADATKGAATTAEKVDALVRFVRMKVKRDDVAGASRRRRKDNRGAAETLARGVGDGTDQTVLFAALASAAMLDTRLALLPDRSDFLSQPNMKQPYFMRHLAVAVRDGDKWQFVDPGNRRAKGGQLAWRHEGQYALLLDDKSPEFVGVPVAEPGRSVKKRTANLKLLEDGTLTGDVTLEYTGQAAVQRRELDDDPPQEREREFREDLVKRLPGAEISNFTVENLENPEAPYIVRFALKAPGYGQRAGSRLLVQPAIMQHGAEALFTASTRHYHVYLPFAWSEQDTITIDFPQDYEVEADAGPTPTGLDGGNAASYFARVVTAPDAPRFTYTRTFFIGARGTILFPPDDYNSVKSFLGLVDRGDGHTVVLRRRAGASQ